MKRRTDISSRIGLHSNENGLSISCRETLMNQKSRSSSPDQPLSESRRSRVWRPKNIASLIYRYILRNILSIYPFEPDEGSGPVKEDSRTVERLIHSNRWFIRMRWRRSRCS